MTARTQKSKITSVPACQASGKKAIIEALKRKYPRQWFDESGPPYVVDVALKKNRASVTLDTSGDALHRRGYRLKAGDAPLRENLAAALVLLSRWEPSRLLVDPLCGSGTIPIEAALFGMGIPPGSGRGFAAETWPHIGERIWREVRTEARSGGAPNESSSLRIYASDIDRSAVGMARENARRANVSECIRFATDPVERFRSSERFGCIICNPPYGERSGTPREAEQLYRRMANAFSPLQDWSYFILTAHPAFERLFGRRATKNRKLYNGNLMTYLYQYFGPLP